MNLVEFEKTINKYNNFYIMGICKNAGKTTTLSRMIDSFKDRYKVGLTSIGRDGEIEDIVTRTEKPRLYIRKDSIIATAEKILSKGDVSKEILYSTDINTSIGKIIIYRARSDGYVEIAGPSINEDIEEISKIFKKEKVDKILVDGAISRKTTSSLDIFDAVILAVGASYDRDIKKVVEDTEYIIELYDLPLADIEEIKSNKKYNIFLKNGRINSISKDNFKNLNKNNIEKIFIKGAVTDEDIDNILSLNIENIRLIVEDSSKIFVSEEKFKILKLRNIKTYVKKKIEIICITINPYSTLGENFNKDEFKARLEEKIDIPIFNIYEF